jgi:hypothetical protein
MIGLFLKGDLLDILAIIGLGVLCAIIQTFFRFTPIVQGKTMNAFLFSSLPMLIYTVFRVYFIFSDFVVKKITEVKGMSALSSFTFYLKALLYLFGLWLLLFVPTVKERYFRLLPFFSETKCNTSEAKE